MKKSKKFLIAIVLFILLFNMSFSTIANAATSDLLISLGTGQYAITVTTSTTIEDIIEILGEPKLTTVSAFGGNAYTFYTDDEYSNYLYIETLENGRIISFGSIDETYKTQTYSYGDDYPYQERSPLFGCLFSDEGIVGGGVYYDKYALDYGNYSDIIDLFENTYLSDPIKYQMGISKHAILMYNALSYKLGNKDTTKLEFNEDYFYINEQFKEFGTTVREYMLDTNLNTQYMKGLTVKSNVEIATRVYFLLNPMYWADAAGNNKYTTFGEKTYALFDYDLNSKVLCAVTLTEDAFDAFNKVSYTDEEIEKLNAGRENYQEAIEKFNEAESMYDVEPQQTEPENLVAGELNQSVKEGIVSYVNAIRVAAGVPDVILNEENFTVAQYKATLLSYRYSQLGLDITHSPEQPEGVSDEFYNKAMGENDEGIRYGYGENIGTATSNINPTSIMNSIDGFLDDSSEKPQLFSHRQKVLSNEYKYFGFGYGEYVFANEFSGTNKYTNFLEAWPSNGITFMETLVSPRFEWTAQFIDKYKVLDTTTATVKCLNTGETWEFEEQEKTTDRWFACHNNSVSSLNNKVVIFDSSILPQAGYVYEITLHGLQNDETLTNEDFTYRAVFEYADTSNYPDSITSLSIEIPENLEKDGENYIAILGDEVKLNAIIDNNEAINKKITWKSSNPDIIEVKQNGTLVIKKVTNTPVTISVVNENTNLIDEVQIIVEEKPNLLKGDVNKDGKVALYDAFRILRYVILGGDNLTEEQRYIMDYNDDGKVALYDAFRFLRQVILG